MSDADRMVINSFNEFGNQIKNLTDVVNRLDGRIFKTDNGLEKIKNEYQKMREFEQTT